MALYIIDQKTGERIQMTFERVDPTGRFSPAIDRTDEILEDRILAVLAIIALASLICVALFNH